MGTTSTIVIEVDDPKFEEDETAEFSNPREAVRLLTVNPIY